MTDWRYYLMQDLEKIARLHPKPLWSGDVDSNKRVEILKLQGLIREGGEGWLLTELGEQFSRIWNSLPSKEPGML